MNSRALQKSIIYVRLATKIQAEEGRGLEAQKSRCLEYANQHGYKNVMEFFDIGSSGTPFICSGLKDMISYLREHPEQNGYRVIVQSPDRIAQDPQTLRKHLNAIQKAGGVVEFLMSKNLIRA